MREKLALADVSKTAILASTSKIALLRSLCTDSGDAMDSGRPITLSERERECVELAARGFSNRDIANTLGISESAANGYIERVKWKLGAETRIEAVVLSLKAGLI